MNYFFMCVTKYLHCLICLIQNKNSRERLQWRYLVDMVVSCSNGISEDCSYKKMQYEIGT